MERKVSLTKEDWIQASWEVISTQGVDAVKVEALARDLGVSKGSFYWHFKNRAELLEALLQYWEQETDLLIQKSQQAPTASARLLKLFTIIEEDYSDCYADTAIFLWAERDAKVTQRVRAVEGKRISYLTKLLQDHGFSSEEAELRAEVAYLAFKGYKDRRSRDSEFSLSLREFTHFLHALLLSPIVAQQQKLPLYSN